MRRDARILVYISVPFLLAAAVLFALAEWFSAGWDGLSRAIYGVIVVGAWIVVVLGYLAWIVVRDGWRRSSILPATVLVAAIAATGIWRGGIWLEDRDCRRAGTFFETLARAEPADRASLIERNSRYVREPTWCGIEAIQYWLGLDNEGRPVAPGGDAGRLAALQELLDHGLSPDDRLLYRAALYGDVEALRLLTGRRRALNASVGGEPAWDVYPLSPALAALRAYEVAASADDPTARDRYAETVKLFVVGGADLCAPVEGRRGLVELMTRAGLPWHEWSPGAVGACAQ